MKTKAFTLVEMLIVMGIIIILMAVGIASGRFAIRRANKIEHQNAAEQIYQGLQSYYSDNREYPDQDTPGDLITSANPLNSIEEYIDDFDGGSEATYAYAVDNTGQEVLVCVTYGGVGDANELGMYCTGNAIGSTDFGAPQSKDMDFPSADYFTAASFFADNASVWNPNPQGTETEWSDAEGDELPPTGILGDPPEIPT
jgi:type II secretory pathway pseudopilin PulG